jgi:g-D-glutamyl-meso-diaminopimelate peptidase
VKKVIGTVIVLVLLGIVLFILLKNKTSEITPIIVPEKTVSRQEIIGRSVEGRPVEAYTFGNGSKKITFVGGIHGGYEWNSVLLAYEFIDYLKKYPEFVPEDITIDVIPSANPDGLFRVTGKEGRFSISQVSTSTEILASGRFNANDVDLNRNFDCKWKSESVWRSKKVSAGTKPFSEPEAEALQKFILKTNPGAVVFWHSQANAVYASQCEEGILPETLDILQAYSKGSGYKLVKTFDAYEVTGAAEDWLASINVPAITVELKTHEAIEWENNLGGIKEILNYYSQENNNKKN